MKGATIDQRDIAASLEAQAKEIAAAAHLFTRMPLLRDQLYAALEQQMDDLSDTWSVLTKKYREERNEKE